MPYILTNLNKSFKLNLFHNASKEFKGIDKDICIGSIKRTMNDVIKFNNLRHLIAEYKSEKITDNKSRDIILITCNPINMQSLLSEFEFIYNINTKKNINTRFKYVQLSKLKKYNSGEGRDNSIVNEYNKFCNNFIYLTPFIAKEQVLNNNIHIADLKERRRVTVDED
jgi:hypothetical protein